MVGLCSWRGFARMERQGPLSSVSREAVLSPTGEASRTGSASVGGEAARQEDEEEHQEHDEQ